MTCATNSERSLTVKEAQEIVNEVEHAPMENGQSWYLLDQNWWSSLMAQMDACRESGTESFDLPEIDNSDLTVRIPSALPEYKLKESLVEKLNYTLVPESVFNVLEKRFGVKDYDRDMKTCKRQVVTPKVLKRDPFVEVYPFKLKVAKNSRRSDIKVVEASYGDTFAELKARALDELSIPKEMQERAEILVEKSANEFEAVDENTSGGALESILTMDTVFYVEDGARRTRSSTAADELNGNLPQVTSSTTGALRRPYTTSYGMSSTLYGLFEYLRDTIWEILLSPYRYYMSVVPAIMSFLVCRSPAERHTPGLCGLQNLGNTCFMNSALQCLSNVPELTEYFLDNRHCSEVNASNVLGTGGRLCYAYANLIKDMWKGTMSSVKPYSFKNVIGQFAPRFNGYNQQDSQELMAYLLDGLHEDLNRIHNKPYVEEKESDGRPDQVVAEEAWSDYKKRNDSIIVDLMHGQLKSTVVCPECDKVSIKFDPVCYLSLPVPAKERLARSTIILVRGRNWQKFSISHTNRTTTRQVTKLIGDEVGIDTKSPEQQIVLLPSYAQTAFLLNPDAPIPVVQYSMYAQPRVFYAYVVDTTETVAIIMNLPSSTFGKQLSQPLVTNFRTPLTFDNILKQALPFVEATSWRQRNNKNDEDEDSAVSSSSSSQGKSPNKNNDNGVRLGSAKIPEGEQAIHSVSIESTSDPIVLTGANPTEEAKFTQMPKPLRISLKWNSSLNFSHPAQLEPEKATELNVPMSSKRGFTLDDCIETFSNQEQLDENDSWYCPKCKTHRRAFKKLDLWKLPKIAIIHLKRFQYSRYSRDKIDTEITIPVYNYQLGGKVANPNHDMPGYDLIAISNHMGGLGSGHYTAKALLKTNNRWCDFNDSCASVSSGTMPSEITSREAYLLVYRRRDAHSDEMNNGGQNISPMQSPMGSPQRPLRPRRSKASESDAMDTD